MKDNLRSFVQIAGLTAILLIVCVFMVWHFGDLNLVLSVVSGYLVSLVNVLFAFFSIKWAFSKSTKTFFSVVLGGMAMRFAILILALLFVWKMTQIPLVGFAASLVGFYLTLQYFEIRFIQKELNGRKAA